MKQTLLVFELNLIKQLVKELAVSEQDQLFVKAVFEQLSSYFPIKKGKSRNVRADLSRMLQEMAFEGKSHYSLQLKKNPDALLHLLEVIQAYFADVDRARLSKTINLVRLVLCPAFKVAKCSQNIFDYLYKATGATPQHAVQLLKEWTGSSISLKESKTQWMIARLYLQNMISGSKQPDSTVRQVFLVLLTNQNCQVNNVCMVKKDYVFVWNSCWKQIFPQFLDFVQHYASGELTLFEKLLAAKKIEIPTLSPLANLIFYKLQTIVTPELRLQLNEGLSGKYTTVRKLATIAALKLKVNQGLAQDQRQFIKRQIYSSSLFFTELVIKNGLNSEFGLEAQVNSEQNVGPAQLLYDSLLSDLRELLKKEPNNLFYELQKSLQLLRQPQLPQPVQKVPGYHYVPWGTNFFGYEHVALVYKITKESSVRYVCKGKYRNGVCYSRFLVQNCGNTISIEPGKPHTICQRCHALIGNQPGMSQGKLLPNCFKVDVVDDKFYLRKLKIPRDADFNALFDRGLVTFDAGNLGSDLRMRKMSAVEFHLGSCFLHLALALSCENQQMHEQMRFMVEEYGARQASVQDYLRETVLHHLRFLTSHFGSHSASTLHSLLKIFSRHSDRQMSFLTNESRMEYEQWVLGEARKLISQVERQKHFKSLRRLHSQGRFPDSQDEKLLLMPYFLEPREESALEVRDWVCESLLFKFLLSRGEELAVVGELPGLLRLIKRLAVLEGGVSRRKQIFSNDLSIEGLEQDLQSGMQCLRRVSAHLRILNCAENDQLVSLDGRVEPLRLFLVHPKTEGVILRQLVQKLILLHNGLVGELHEAARSKGLKSALTQELSWEQADLNNFLALKGSEVENCARKFTAEEYRRRGERRAGLSLELGQRLLWDRLSRVRVLSQFNFAFKFKQDLLYEQLYAPADFSLEQYLTFRKNLGNRNFSNERSRFVAIGDLLNEGGLLLLPQYCQCEEEQLVSEELSKQGVEVLALLELFIVLFLTNEDLSFDPEKPLLEELFWREFEEPVYNCLPIPAGLVSYSEKLKFKHGLLVLDRVRAVVERL